MGHAFLTRAEFHEPSCKLQRNEGGDVGNGEAHTGHIGLARELAIQPSGHRAHLFALRAAKVGELRLLQRGQAGVGVANTVGKAAQQVELYASVCHLNERALLVVQAHQIRLRVAALQVGANGAGFGEHAAIVQLQRGYFGLGAFGQKGVGFVFVVGDADADLLQISHPFFSQKNGDAARAGRARGNV